MPTYEYECVSCSDRFERFQKMSDPPVTECPACGAAVRKVMHPPAIAFKGPGFHVNDYAAKGSRPTASSSLKSESDSGASVESKPEAKTDTKTATKSEPTAETKTEAKADKAAPAKA